MIANRNVAFYYKCTCTLVSVPVVNLWISLLFLWTNSKQNFLLRPNKYIRIPFLLWLVNWIHPIWIIHKILTLLLLNFYSWLYLENECQTADTFLVLTLLKLEISGYFSKHSIDFPPILASFLTKQCMHTLPMIWEKSRTSLNIKQHPRVQCTWTFFNFLLLVDMLQQGTGIIGM